MRLRQLFFFSFEEAKQLLWMLTFADVVKAAVEVDHHILAYSGLEALSWSRRDMSKT